MTVGSASSLNSFSSITNGKSSVLSAKILGDKAEFAELLDRLQSETKSGGKNLLPKGRLNGDITTGFAGTFTSQSDKNALPSGAAASTLNRLKNVRIDKTSELYEKSMELENYFVKQILSSMRKTVVKTTNDGFAGKMYEDMLFDEFSVQMTKKAGFGIADQIYLQLKRD